MENICFEKSNKVVLEEKRAGHLKLQDENHLLLRDVKHLKMKKCFVDFYLMERH